MFDSLRGRKARLPPPLPEISPPLGLVVPQNSPIESSLTPLPGTSLTTSPGNSLASSPDWPIPSPASPVSLTNSTQSFIPSPLRECHFPPSFNEDKDKQPASPVSRSNASTSTLGSSSTGASSSTATSTSTLASTLTSLRAFPIPIVPACAKQKQQSIPYMQLMYQCKFLASEWDHIFGTVHMLPGVGAAGLCLLMDSSIVSAYVIAFEYDRLLHSFRTAHISIRGSPAFQPLPPPPGMLQTNSSEGFEEKYKFGVVDFKRDVKECCRVWNEAVSVFKERFEEWLNISPEKASDGLKACLARAVYVGAEMKRIAGPDGTKRKWAGYDDRKEEAEELRKKLDCVGAEFLRIIGGNPEGADPF